MNCSAGDPRVDAQQCSRAHRPVVRERGLGLASPSMGWALLTLLGAAAAVATAMIWLTRGRNREPDVGQVSDAWIAHHRAERRSD
jgi:hypothetical protein